MPHLNSSIRQGPAGDKPVVALDVDNVLADFDSHWQQCAEDCLGRSVARTSSDYSLVVRYNLTSREYSRVCEAYRREWAKMPLFLYVGPLIQGLERLGCEVWAVTSIDARLHEARAEMLAGLIHPERIRCVGHPQTPGWGAGDTKAIALREIGAIAFLDDHPENANSCVDATLLSVFLDMGYTGLEAPIQGVTVINEALDFLVLVEDLLHRTRRHAA